MLPFLTFVPMDVAHQGFVQARVEERLRSGNDIKAAETEFNPQIRYDGIWQGGQSHFVAIYQPRFIYTSNWDRRLPDPNLISRETINDDDPNAHPFSALHNGGLGIELVRNRWRLSLYQFAAYGPITTTALLVNAPWGGDGLPPDPNPIIPATISARFTLLFIQTQLFVPIRLSRRVALIPGFVYNAFGGANRESRGTMALTQGPGASLALDVAASRNDRFISTIGGGRIDTTFQNEEEGATIYRSEATQAWRHWWSNNLSTEVMAGASLGGDEVNGFSLFSTGHVAMLWDSYPLPRVEPGAQPYGVVGGHGPRLQLGAILRTAPWIDLFSGDLEQRGVGTLVANYTVDRTTFRGVVSTARVFNTPRSIAEYEIYLGEGGVRYRLFQTFSIDLGVRVGYQNFNNAVRFNELTQFTAFGGVAWTPLPARF